MWTMPRSVLRVVAVILAICAVGGFVLGVRGAPERARLPGESATDAAALQATDAQPLDDLTSRVIALTERFHLADSVLLSSFNPINLSKARRQNPKIRRGLLVSPGDRLMLGAGGRLFPYHALHPYYEDVTPEMAADLRVRGKQLNTWTVDDPQALLRLHSIGVDGIISNNPAAARAVLEGS